MHRGRSLKATVRRDLLHGKSKGYLGIFPSSRGSRKKRYKQYIRVFLRQYQLSGDLSLVRRHGGSTNTPAPCAWPAG
jgi:hypothetical protein